VNIGSKNRALRKKCGEERRQFKNRNNEREIKGKIQWKKAESKVKIHTK
jgi:hypothetical protein